MPPPWREYYAALSGISVRGRPALRTQMPALRWNYSLHPDELQRGVAYPSSAARLRTLLSDVQDGRRRSLRIGVVGGSISWGTLVDAPGEDWFSLFAGWLAAAFPNVDVAAHNGAVPATPSGFMELCLDKHLPADTDLVILEYATNDATHEAPGGAADAVSLRTFERLLRKVLALPSRPAVVLLHLPTKGQAYAAGTAGKVGFTDTPEDTYNAAAAYYQLPTLSLRDAVWHLAEHHERGGNWSDYYGTDWYKVRPQPADYLHPSSPGHHATADLMVWLMHRTLLGLALQPMTVRERAAALRGLPSPMYPGNFEGPTRLCVNGAEFSSVVVAHDGWTLVNEGDDVKQKWGFVATQPDAHLALEINTTRIAAPQLPSVFVLLAHLRSFEHMGRARVECEAGCTCEAQVVDAHHTLRSSTVFLQALAASQAPTCRIGVTVLNETSSGDHKFKVTGVMVSEGTAHMRTVLGAEEWLGFVNAGFAKSTPP